jgi:hypothetical protein
MANRKRTDSRIIVGSKVIITDAGNSYTSWHEMADLLKLTQYGGDGPYVECERKVIGRVISFLPHNDGEDTVYGIRIGKKDFIVNQEGIEYHLTNEFPEGLFTL